MGEEESWPLPHKGQSSSLWGAERPVVAQREQTWRYLQDRPGLEASNLQLGPSVVAAVVL